MSDVKQIVKLYATLQCDEFYTPVQDLCLGMFCYKSDCFIRVYLNLMAVILNYMVATWCGSFIFVFYTYVDIVLVSLQICFQIELKQILIFVSTQLFR